MNLTFFKKETAGRWLSASVPATKKDIALIIMKVSELAGALKNVSDRIDKAQKEIVDEINTLKASLGDVEIPADAQASIDRLTAQAQALDDLNPDAAAPAATATT